MRTKVFLMAALMIGCRHGTPESSGLRNEDGMPADSLHLEFFTDPGFTSFEGKISGIEVSIVKSLATPRGAVPEGFKGYFEVTPKPQDPSLPMPAHTLMFLVESAGDVMFIGDDSSAILWVKISDRHSAPQSVQDLNEALLSAREGDQFIIKRWEYDEGQNHELILRVVEIERCPGCAVVDILAGVIGQSGLLEMQSNAKLEIEGEKAIVKIGSQLSFWLFTQPGA